MLINDGLSTRLKQLNLFMKWFDLQQQVPAIRKAPLAILFIGLSLTVCTSPKKKMETQQNQSEQTGQPSETDTTQQQEGGGKSVGKEASPSQHPPQPAHELPDTVREIPIGSPMAPAEWERLKREAEKPSPRPPKKNDETEGQQDTPEED